MHFLYSDSPSWRSRRSPEILSRIRVERVVRAYEKDGDRLIDEFQLKDVSLLELQKLFGESKQNGMVDSYPISRTQAEYFQQHLKTNFNFEALDYFLECDAM